MWDVVLFDYDDTLVDTRGTRFPAIKRYCLDRHGIEVSDEMIVRAWGRPFSEKMKEFGCSPPEVSMDEYLKVAKDFPIRAFDDSELAIRALSRVVPIGIVSSVSRAILLDGLDSLGWNRELFVVLQGEEDSAFHKPDPRVFDPVLRTLESKLGDGSRRVLYIGDSVNDALAATGAGFEFCGVARDSASRKAFLNHGLNSVANLREISGRFRSYQMQP